MASLIGQVKNGNYIMQLWSDGTKIRYNNLNYFEPNNVESIDLKITNCCNVGCPMCHENSVPNGKHGDILNLPFLDTMPPYSEIALGGGNPLTHPDLVPFLKQLKKRKLIPNMTVNQIHFMESVDFIKTLVDNKLVYGLGVSLVNANDDFINAIKQFPNAVIHVINGIVTIEQLKTLAHHNLKILILGYKEFRRGETLYAKENERIETLKSEFYDMLPEIISDNWFDCVSFDNLAIKQLNPRRFMSENEYDQFYMGNDGQFTCYIDAVNREFAVSSVSTRRYPLMGDIVDMFKVVKEDANG